MKFKKIIVGILFLFLLISISSATDNITDVTLDQAESLEPINQAVDEKEVNDVNDEEELSANVNKELISSQENTILSQNNEEAVLSVSDDSSYQNIIDTCTVNDRTFKIGKYGVVISKIKFANLYTARDVEDYYWDQGGDYAFDYGEKIGDFTCGVEGISYYFKVNTNKYVKQKIGIGYKGDKLTKMKAFKSKYNAKKYKKVLKKKYEVKIKKKKGKYVVYKVTPKYKKIVTKKVRVFFIFAYGNTQYGVGNYKYAMHLCTKYQNPGYDIVKGGLFKYKYSSTLNGLKNAKTISY